MSKTKNSSNGSVWTLVFFLSFVLSASGSFARTFYISNTGLDTNSGMSESDAWQTLSKVNAVSFQPGDQILFKRGDTFYGSLTISNSGNADNPILFSAYGSGPNPVITGFTTVTDWVSLGNNIWESAAPVSTLPTCNMVVIDGKNTAMGRWPNNGYLTFESHTGSNSITDNQLSSSINWTGAEAVVRSARYILDRVTVASQVNGTLIFSKNLMYEPKDGFGFFIQNDPRTLDSENEWYYNPVSGRIRIWSITKPSNKKFQSSTIDNLITIGGSFNNISGIDFEGANSYAIFSSLKGIYGIKIENNSFKNIGRIAIKMRSNGIYVANNLFRDCQSRSIDLAYSTRTVVKNNNIKNSGILEGMGDSGNGIWAAVYVANISNLNVSYNRVVNSGYNAISYGSGDSTIIAFNYIDTFCTVLDDGGGIYGGINADIYNNIIVNGIGTPQGTQASESCWVYGLYFDRNSKNCEAYNNTISNCALDGIIMNNPSNIYLHDNVVFDCGRTNLRINNIKGYNSVTGNKIKRNILVQKKANPYTFNYSSFQNDVTSFAAMDSNFYCHPINQTNLIYLVQSSFSGSQTLEQWKKTAKQDFNSAPFNKTIKSEADLVLFYNDSIKTKKINLPFAMIDIKGAKYAESVDLKPFTSIVLLPDPNPIKHSIEYKSICEGTQYQGWGTTGKYVRTLKTSLGADSVVTTYLTVNPRYSITETIEISEGESYHGWTKSGLYTRNLNSTTGCDSIVTTNLVVKSAANKQGQIIPTHFVPSNSNSGENSMMEITVVSANLGLLTPKAGDEVAVFCRENCLATVVLSGAIDENNDSSFVTFKVREAGINEVGFIAGDPISFRVWNATEQTESTVSLVDYLADDPSWITNGRFCSNALAFATLSYTKSVATGTNSIASAGAMSVYPNPCKGKFNVRLSDTSEKETQIRIFDLGGREIVSRLQTQPTEQFDLQGSRPGIYLVTAVSRNTKVSQRVIVD